MTARWHWVSVGFTMMTGIVPIGPYISPWMYVPWARQMTFYQRPDHTPQNRYYFDGTVETIQKNGAYLEDKCHVQVVEMCGCEWQRIKKEPAIRQYLDATFDEVKPSYT